MKQCRVLSALALALALAMACAACGGSTAAGDGFDGGSSSGPSPASSASSFGVAHYANEEYGFSIDYPAGFTKLEVPPDTTNPASPKLDVFFADPDGTQVAGTSVDTLEVAVYRMSAAPKKSDFTTNRGDFEAMLGVLVGQPPGLKVVEPVVWTTVDGRPAVTETYTYTVSGHDVAASVQLAFKGDGAYLVRAQAARETWATTGRQLVSCMATFAFL